MSTQTFTRPAGGAAAAPEQTAEQTAQQTVRPSVRGLRTPMVEPPERLEPLEPLEHLEPVDPVDPAEHEASDGCAPGSASAVPAGDSPPTPTPAADPAGVRRRAERSRVRRILADSSVVLLVLMLGHAVLAQEAASAVPSVVLGLGWAASLAVSGHGDPRIGAGAAARRMLGASVAAFGGAALLWWSADLGAPPRHLLVALPIGAAALLLGQRLGRRRLLRRRRRGLDLRRVVVVGDPAGVGRTMAVLARGGPSLGMTAVASVLDDGPARTPRDEEELVARVVDAVTRRAADVVVLAGGDRLTPRAVEALGWAVEDLDVRLALLPELGREGPGRVTVQQEAGACLLHVARSRRSGATAMLKRASDVLGSGLGLVLLAPVFALVAAAVRLDSRGPVIFRQERVGRDHERFMMLKFRSMAVDADARRDLLAGPSDGNSVMFKLRRDPRVTRVGRVIRRLSLDELPQLVNVLRGDMSLVGPRPPLPAEVAAYDDRALRRLHVRPGITGLWQVSGRSELSWEDTVRMDLTYVENWSLAGDAAIVARTARAVVGGSGAY